MRRAVNRKINSGVRACPAALRALAIGVFIVFALPAGVPVHATNYFEYSPAENSPELFSVGGAFIGIDGGYAALFTNPAVLTTIPATSSYYNQTAWMHNELEHLFPSIGDIFAGGLENSTADTGIPALVVDNGFGFGGSIVTAYYGNNFAIGAALGHDIFLYGTNYPDALYAQITNDIRLLIAFAYPIELGIVDISFGFSVEPFYRIRTETSPAETLDLLNTYLGGSGGITSDTLTASSFLRGENSLYGNGVAVHAGLLVVIADTFSLGLTLRDIGDTQISYSRTTFADVADGLERLSPPPAALPGDDGYITNRVYSFPARIRLGFAYHPSVPDRYRVQPRVAIEIDESILTFQTLPDYSIFHSLHLGLSVVVDNWFEARLGLNQGQLTLGTGFDFGIFEIETAWFGRIVRLPQETTSSHGLILSIHIDSERRQDEVRNIRRPR